MRNARRWAVSSYLAAVLAFIYLPIVIMMAMAFNRSSLYELPFQFSLTWFAQLLHNVTLWRAGRNSLLIAAANTVIATTLGTMVALAFARYRIRGQAILQVDQGAVHQGTALSYGQTHVAQAANNRPEQIGGQVIQRAGWGPISHQRNAWGRHSNLVWFRRQWGTELAELGQMWLALA